MRSTFPSASCPACGDERPPAPRSNNVDCLIGIGRAIGSACIIFDAILSRAKKGMCLSPMAIVGPGFETASIWIGGVAFAATVWWMYRWIERMAGA